CNSMFPVCFIHPSIPFFFSSLLSSCQCVILPLRSSTCFSFISNHLLTFPVKLAARRDHSCCTCTESFLQLSVFIRFFNFFRRNFALCDRYIPMFQKLDNGVSSYSF